MPQPKGSPKRDPKVICQWAFYMGMGQNLVFRGEHQLGFFFVLIHSLYHVPNEWVHYRYYMDSIMGIYRYYPYLMFRILPISL